LKHGEMSSEQSFGTKYHGTMHSLFLIVRLVNPHMEIVQRVLHVKKKVTHMQIYMVYMRHKRRKCPKSTLCIGALIPISVKIFNRTTQTHENTCGPVHLGINSHSSYPGNIASDASPPLKISIIPFPASSFFQIYSPILLPVYCRTLIFKG